jgi:predicted transposase YbfD/YdcC
VKPKTGSYLHEYVDSDGVDQKDNVTFEYQSISEVYKHIIVSLMTEHSVDIRDIEKTFIILGGDHGIGAFRMPFRNVLVLRDGRHLKKDIGIATIVCKKDTGKVILNTIMDWLTEDLKEINHSNVVLSTDASGNLQCDLQPKTNTSSHSLDTGIYVTGDIKWFCMLLGMEGMAPHYCVYCSLRKQDWKKCGHCKGDPRTIQSIIDTVNKYNITEGSRTNPNHRGVKAKPFWDFIPIKNYCLSLLHIWMGIYNDIDEWFMNEVRLLMSDGDVEVELKAKVASLTAATKDWVGKYDEFNKSNDGKKYKKLTAKVKKSVPLTPTEKIELDQLIVVRDEVVLPKEAAKQMEKDAKKELDDFVKSVKKKSDGFYQAIQDHWKAKGKSKAAYHGGAWNGKYARDAMREPEVYYWSMRSLLLNFKSQSTETQQIDRLLSRVCRLLHRWHDVFHNLRSEKREPGWSVALGIQIADAVKLHRKFGLTVTPKVHIMEDHGVELAEEMPLSFFYTIEEFVEQNHQTGHKEEERVK